MVKVGIQGAIEGQGIIPLTSEGCCGEPEEMVVIVGVDVLRGGVDKFPVVVGEDPVVVSAGEDHAYLSLWWGP